MSAFFDAISVLLTIFSIIDAEPCPRNTWVRAGDVVDCFSDFGVFGFVFKFLLFTVYISYCGNALLLKGHHYFCALNMYCVSILFSGKKLLI